MITTATPPRIVPSDPDFLEREAGIEFVEGQVLEKPTSILSALVESEIAHLLCNYTFATGVGTVFSPALGYRCYREDARMFRKPDVSFVRCERLAGIDIQEPFMPIPADLVVEVISPNDLHDVVVAKIDEYLKNGFNLIWIVNPPTRTVHVYRRDGNSSLLREGDEIGGESALPGFKCKVGEFFGKNAAVKADLVSNA